MSVVIYECYIRFSNFIYFAEAEIGLKEPVHELLMGGYGDAEFYLAEDGKDEGKASGQLCAAA